MIYNRLTFLSSVFILILFCSCEKDEVLLPVDITQKEELIHDDGFSVDSASVLDLADELNNPVKIFNVQKELFDFHSNIAAFLQNKKVHSNAGMGNTARDSETNQNDPNENGYLTSLGPRSKTFEDLNYIPHDWYFLQVVHCQNEQPLDVDKESGEVIANQKRETSFDRIVTP